MNRNCTCIYCTCNCSLGDGGGGRFPLCYLCTGSVRFGTACVYMYGCLHVDTFFFFLLLLIQRGASTVQLKCFIISRPCFFAGFYSVKSSPPLNFLVFSTSGKQKVVLRMTMVFDMEEWKVHIYLRTLDDWYFVFWATVSNLYWFNLQLEPPVCLFKALFWSLSTSLVVIFDKREFCLDASIKTNTRKTQSSTHHANHPETCGGNLAVL